VIARGSLGREVAAERCGAGPENRLDLRAGLRFEVGQPRENDPVDQIRRQRAVVHRRVRPREEHPLTVDLAAVEVRPDDLVCSQQGVAVLDQRDHRHRLRTERPDPRLDRPIADRAVRLADDELLVVVVDGIELTRVRHHRHDHLVDRRDCLGVVYSPAAPVTRRRYCR
jgi:hypothetical protein